MTSYRRTSATRIRPYLRCLISGAAGLCVLGTLGSAGPAFAQTTPGTAGPISLGELFTAPNHYVLKPGAGKTFTDKAREALGALPLGQCPKPTITITVAKDDPLFQRALAAARRDTLKILLGRDADKFQFVENIEGTTGNVEIDASVADTAPPTITVDPPSGTKVKVGDRLTIKATATEPSTGWQAGVKHIHIEDPYRHTNLDYWDNPAQAPRPCGNAGLTKTIQGSYVVPNEPVARLKIKARDYHNPLQELLVEYPTGDWTGTFRWDSTSTHRVTAQADIVLNHDGKGNLTGSMVGVHELFAPPGRCSATTPNRFRVSLVGAYTEGRSFKVFVREIDETKITNVCAPGQAGLGFKNVWYPETFLGTPSPMGEGEILADGTRQYKYGPAGPTRDTATVTLRPARN